MTTIVTRLGKGSPLTFLEEDTNFTNLNTFKYEAGDSPTFATIAATNITITSATDGIPLVLSDGTGTANFDFSSGHLYFGTTSAHDLFFKVGGVSVARIAAASGSIFTAPIGTNPDLDIGNGQIKFPATQVPSANVNTLDDYEEGTWTPVDASGAALSFVTASGTYTKIGRLVFVRGIVQYPVTSDVSGALVGGLPFTASATALSSGFTVARCTYGTLTIEQIANSATFQFRSPTGTELANDVLTSHTVRFSGCYEANA
jgi:hypothetical protein